MMHPDPVGALYIETFSMIGEQMESEGQQWTI
jgi:hypothetical protein